ncbi:hypothetical protein PIB30_018476 [Stylosanthes scabra]|uniref:Uncharacterized protein n=1 Tax=Stylosanthes scabra TaxID=79078 RepID=A0ABU6W957_9FABA|nr:hypothetical protein [Stylosanthes scabra]
MEGEGEGEEALKGISGGSSSSSRCVAKCSDCGNQAKKDCSYNRCRTCCKNKGFHCPTHVRSTWIPVHTRRHKSSPSSSSSPLVLMDHHHHHHQQHFLHSHIPKRHKHIPEEFPASVSSMAIFRCVRVRSMDESVNEIAYQTSVNIGGHLFTGLLYDQGPHHHHHHHQPPPRSIDYPHHHHQLQSNNNNIIDAPLPHHDQPFISSSSSYPLLPLPSPFVRPTPNMPYYFSSPSTSDYPK